METTRHHEPRFSALVVDDNYPLREAIARSLAREGGDVTTAPGGLEGLEAIRSHQFDVVITDVYMPRMGPNSFCASEMRASITVAEMLPSGEAHSEYN